MRDTKKIIKHNPIAEVYADLWDKNAGLGQQRCRPRKRVPD